VLMLLSRKRDGDGRVELTSGPGQVGTGLRLRF
jgi:hypothetical protein